MRGKAQGGPLPQQGGWQWHGSPGHPVAPFTTTLYDCIRRFVHDHSFTLTTRDTRVQQDGRLSRQALARGSSSARAGQTDPTDGVGTPPLPTVGSACGGAMPANAARRRADSVEGGRRPASAGVRDREAPVRFQLLTAKTMPVCDASCRTEAQHPTKSRQSRREGAPVMSRRQRDESLSK